MTTRHEFLAQLHQLLKPRHYLEVGVQHGTSLNLASYSEIAIGIDPLPLCVAHGNQQIFSVTADEYFQYYVSPDDWVDLAFIDGSHIFEDALRDFINIEHISHDKSIIAFDDVLPYNEEIATRSITPGDWTGDVWKIYYVLSSSRENLQIRLVDTFPTGTMIVWNLDPRDNVLPVSYPQILDEYQETEKVPEEILNRSIAVSPAQVINELKEALI